MGTEVINVSFDVLQEKLDKAKSNLRGLNDNIRRISGREPPDQLSRNEKKRPLDRRSDRERGNDYDNRNRRNGGGDSSPPPKRKLETKSVFSRLSGPPNSKDDEKPKLNSRIIRELPTKEEIVEAQGSDPASRARNRRMFGSLLGTLQKFCQEESRLKNKEEKKAKIEKKLEEQQNQEREIMKKERQCLYNNRKRQQLEIKMLENKMNLMKEFNSYEEMKKPLMNFIRTKTKPHIYYLPKVLDKTTESKLADSKRDIQKQIEKRRNEVNKEMAEIVSRFESAAEVLQTDQIGETGLNVSQENDKARDSQSDDDHKAVVRSAVNNNASINSSRYKDDRPANGNESSNDDGDSDGETKSIANKVAIKVEKDEEAEEGELEEEEEGTKTTKDSEESVTQQDEANSAQPN